MHYVFEFLAPATSSTFASVAAAAGLKSTTGEKPTTATKKVLPKPVNFEPPGSQSEPKNPWTLVNKCHSKSGQNFSPDDGSQVGSQTLHSLVIMIMIIIINAGQDFFFFFEEKREKNFVRVQT